MLETFFSDINSTWEYLYEPAFRETFSHAVETDFKHVRRSWLGLLNLILAMVKRRKNADTESAGNVRDPSDIYFSRALVLTTRTMFRRPNLETGRFSSLRYGFWVWSLTLKPVQCLLLTTVYLHRRTSVQCWMMHGLAVKAAYTLGLHSNEHHANLSERQREMRKRAWWGCVNLDRYIKPLSSCCCAGT